MGSARTSDKEFDQLKGALGSRGKSADTASSTMEQSFRSASAGGSSAFGQSTSQSQSAGGQFAPMSAGLGSLSSTGPVQCSKKKEPKVSKMDQYFNDNMEAEDYESIAAALIGYKSRADMGGATDEASNASYQRMMDMYRNVSNGTERDRGGMIQKSTRVLGRSNGANLDAILNGTGNADQDHVHRLDFNRRLAMTAAMDGHGYERDSDEPGMLNYFNMIHTMTSARKVTDEVDLMRSMEVYQNTSEDDMRNATSPALLSGTAAEQGYAKRLLNWKAPWEVEEEKQKKHRFRRWLN